MPDLNERLRGVDHAAVPDLWAEAKTRASEARREETAYRARLPHELPPRRRLAIIALAFAVFAAAAAFAWNIWSRTDRRPAVNAPTPTPSVTPDPWSGLSPGIHRFSAPPSVRTGAALQWMGSTFVVWGGSQKDGATQFADGFVFDPRTDSWSPLPPSPLSARSFSSSVWTGSELLIWGGWDGRNGHFNDGAAYDPVAKTWRLLAASPLDARAPRGAIWTGSEMIAWGTLDAGPPSDLRDVTGASYDPATDTWRAIADAPYPINWGSVVWTGKEMIVLGASVHAGNRADTASAVGMAYDPASDTWRDLPSTDLNTNGTFATWANDELFAFDYTNQVRAYDPLTNAWRHLPAPPTASGEAWPEFAAAGHEVFASTFGGTAVFDLQKETWRTVTLPQKVVGLLSPVPAGNAVVLWDSGELYSQPSAGKAPDLMVWVPGQADVSSPASSP